MSVDRCICTNQTFEQLLHDAKSLGLEHDLEALEAATGVGGSCGICRTYLRVVLATGKTVLPVLSPEELELLLEQAKQQQSGCHHSGCEQARFEQSGCEQSGCKQSGQANSSNHSEN